MNGLDGFDQVIQASRVRPFLTVPETHHTNPAPIDRNPSEVPTLPPPGGSSNRAKGQLFKRIKRALDPPTRPHFRTKDQFHPRKQLQTTIAQPYSTQPFRTSSREGSKTSQATRLINTSPVAPADPLRRFAQ